MTQIRLAKMQTTATMRAAVLGIVGAVLTVCGGLAGAAISVALTIYQVERGRDTVAISAPGGDQPLTVDVREIGISYQEAMGLDAGAYFVAPELGFVLAQPRQGWGSVEETTYGDLFLERGAYSGSTWDQQPIRRIRYGEAIEVQCGDGSLVNGVALDCETLRQAYDTDAFRYANEIAILSLDKEAAAGYTLAGVALEWGITQRGGLNRIIASEGADSVVMQASWHLEDVIVDGQEGDLGMERWALVADGPLRYYVIEVTYFALPGQSVQVWEDLQAYMRSFRVIQ
jgi:hypothetical protein